jgi:hypothetical protein
LPAGIKTGNGFGRERILIRASRIDFQQLKRYRPQRQTEL